MYSTDAARALLPIPQATISVTTVLLLNNLVLVVENFVHLPKVDRY
jgi:hypothetical protein